MSHTFFEKNNFYIITGGPGVGKTTLLKALEEEGYQVVPEVAREIIREQVETGGDAVPWANVALYTEFMLKGSVESYMEHVKNENIVFFDRGILDTVCYSEMTENRISAEMDAYAKNCIYNRKVFILPPWFEIYATDSERKQNWKEAETTYHKMKAMYERYGYNVIDVPKDSVENRRDFVIFSIT